MDARHGPYHANGSTGSINLQGKPLNRNCVRLVKKLHDSSIFIYLVLHKMNQRCFPGVLCLPKQHSECDRSPSLLV